MAGGTKVGTGYLEVTPKLASNFNKTTDSAGTTAGQGFGSKFSGAARSAIGAGTVALGNILANAATQAASAVADAFAQAFQGSAQFEQLAGGVEKIFDQANASQIFADANNAYKDLNMSANQYLEAINSVGATFAQTMGDQRGYDTARQGMMAIADYASGTGRNLDELNQKYQLISRSTSSYQSIADQFAGLLPQTSKDFLAQAQAAGYLSDAYTSLTEVPVAEYQQALTQMLSKGVADMGLAGNTAMESTKTLSGSIAMLSSSWQNLLTGILDENADVGQLFENFVSSVGAVASNLAPRLATLFTRIFTELPGAIANAFMELPSKLEPILQRIFGEELGSKMSESLGEGIQNLMGAFDSIWQVVQTVWPSIQEIITGAMTVIGEVMTVAWPLITAVVDTAMTMIQTHIQIVWPVIQGIISAAVGAIVGIIQGLAPIVSVVTTIFNGIKSAIVDPVNTARDLISGAIEAIKSLFNFNIQWPHIPLPHFSVSGSPNPLDWLGGNTPSISIEWYAKGGFVDGATLIGAGEAGPEMILPKSGGLMTDFAEALSNQMNGGSSPTVIIDGARINDEVGIRDATKTYLLDLHRIGAI